MTNPSLGRGFTLVELAIVILIISLLVLVAMPSIYLIRQNSQRAYCMNNLRQINGATQQYLAQHNATIVPAITDLTDYFLPAKTPECRSGGIYQMPGTPEGSPTCTLSAYGHVLEN